jgi:hypothetical protein
VNPESVQNKTVHPTRGNSTVNSVKALLIPFLIRPAGDFVVGRGDTMELGDIKDLESFCARWQTKAAEYDLNTLAGTFDNFFSLFVVYNRLYAATARRLVQTGRIKAQDETDRKSATGHVV